jgi:rhamnose transport system substrate-binding protein
VAVALGRNPESATGGEGMTSSSPYRRLLASLVIAALALFAAACGETKNDSSTSSGGSSSQAASGDAGANPNAPIKQGLKMVSIPKQLGNPYEEFEHSGVVEAAKELGGSDRIQGSTDAGASSQVPIINSIVQQKPDAIIIAGNDPNAVAPALKQAAQRGIKVVGMDSDVAPDARSVFVNQVTTKLVGENQVESIAKQIDNKGQIAILSATANATNQNAWIKVMKDTLKQPKYKDIKLVKVAYGDDDDQKSFQQMQGLIQAYPNLKGVISPTTVGVAAAARYLSKSPEKGKVKLTGLGFPNQMRKFVEDGTVDEFQLWVPKDVGYLAGQAAAALASGRITGKQGETFTAGRLGKYTIGENGEIVLGPLTTFNKENISKFDF